MARLFATVVGLLLLLGAAVHGYRLYRPFEIIFAGYNIPMWDSWLTAIVAAFLGSMVLVETRRK